jgi:hypothetical protein
MMKMLVQLILVILNLAAQMYRMWTVMTTMHVPSIHVILLRIVLMVVTLRNVVPVVLLLDVVTSIFPAMTRLLALLKNAIPTSVVFTLQSRVMIMTPVLMIYVMMLLVVFIFLLTVMMKIFVLLTVALKTLELVNMSMSTAMIKMLVPLIAVTSQPENVIILL